MGAVRFTASSSERWSVTSGTRLDRMSDYTIMAWVRQASSDLLHGWFSLWSDGDNYEQFGVGTLYTGNYETFISGWGSAVFGSVTGGAVLSTGTWYHITARRTGNTCELYVDGTLDISCTLANTTGSKNTLTQTAGCLINYDGTYIYSDDGRMAHVKAWQAALTAQEIRSEMRSVVPQRLANLYDYWPTVASATRAIGYAKGITWTETNTPTDEAGPETVPWGAAILMPMVPASTGITGTVAATIAGVTSAASGTETFTGTSAATIATPTSAASGTETFTGSASATVAGVTSAASGTETFTGTVAATLAGVTSSAAGTETFTGTASPTISGVTSAATGTETFTGTCSATIGAPTCAASGTVTVGITGTVAATIAGVTSTATGTETFTGSCAATIAAVTCAASGVNGADNFGSCAATIDAVVCTAAGLVMVETNPTVLSGTLDLSATLTGTLDVSRTLTGELTTSATLEGIHGID